MLKRVFAAAIVACLASAGLAQNVSTASGLSPEEERILVALGKLRNETQLYLFIQGSETIGSATKQLKTHVYWQTDAEGGRDNARVQILHFENDQLVQRIVGNGQTLWNYDLRNSEYSSVDYGGYAAARPERYQRTLLQLTSNAAKGQAAYAARLLREVFGEDIAVYRTWMPGVRPYPLPQGRNEDPVLRWRTYDATPTVDYIMFNGAPRRTIVFELEDDPPSDDRRLSSIYFNESAQVGDRIRETEWHLTPYKGIVFDPANFRPFSYEQTRGWRPVVGQQPTSKG